MKKFTLIYLAFGLALFSFILTSSSNGVADVQGVDRTGSPLSLPTCGSCHAGGNFGTGFTIEILDQTTGAPITAYTPGQTYDVEYTVTSSVGIPQAFGFQSVALMGAGNAQAGAYSFPSTNTETHVIGNGRTYVEQLSESASNLFTIEWTAPAAGNGAVTFYGIGNAVNDDGSTFGDDPSNPISVTLQEQSSCNPPATLSSNVTNDDVLLQWSAVSGATGYEITGGPSSAPDAVTLAVGNVTSFQVNNLTRNVTYVWKVKAICGGDASAFSATDQFFIPPLVCDPPGPISSTVTGNSVTLNWTPKANAIGYIIQGGPASSPTAVTLQVPNGAQSSLTVNNLNPGGYAWRIQQACQVSPTLIVSTFTAFDQFAIVSPPQKGEEPLLNQSELSLQLYPNPASEIVNVALDNAASEALSIELYDLNGKLIQIQESWGETNVQMNLSGVRNGIYQVVARTATTTTNQRLVVNR